MGHRRAVCDDARRAACGGHGAGRAAAAARRRSRQPPPPLNESDVEKYRKLAEAEPSSVAPRVALANLYFDAERYSDAVKWYEEAMKLDARNADVSTDLGVSYYYLNQPDRALQQFEHSLSINPEAHQDDAEPGHRAGLRQAGPRRRVQGLAAGGRHCAGTAPRARPPSVPSTR